MILQLPGSHIISYNGISPKLGEETFLASGCQIIGDVVAKDLCSFWFNTVIRGDCNFIRIGRRVNIQDGTIIHVTNHLFPTHIADDVSVGHNAVIHGCTIGEGTLVGMSATILDGAVIGARSLVAAGSLVSPGKVFPDGWLLKGIPAQPVRELTPKEHLMREKTTEYYLEYKNQYRNSQVLSGP